MEPSKTNLIILLLLLCCMCCSIQNINFNYNFNKNPEKIPSFFSAANSAIVIISFILSALFITYNVN